MSSGPNIQMPASVSEMFDVVTGDRGELVALNLKIDWAAFFQLLQQNAFVASRNGPTAERPTSSTIGRFIGMPYFDTTLGFTVFLKTASSSVWVDGAGVVR